MIRHPRRHQYMLLYQNITLWWRKFILNGPFQMAAKQIICCNLYQNFANQLLLFLHVDIQISLHFPNFSKLVWQSWTFSMSGKWPKYISVNDHLHLLSDVDETGLSNFTWNWIKTVDFFALVNFEIWWMTSQNNRAPLPYYTKLCESFQAIGKFKLGLQSGNAPLGQNRRFFVPCDLEIR